MATATGTREIPFERQVVWRSLTALTKYCPVCDVSYVFDEETSGSGQALGLGSRFFCAPGRLQDGELPPSAVVGEIVEWSEQILIGTRLELASETWRTRIELSDVAQGFTRVTVTVVRKPKGGSRLLHGLQRRTLQRLVQHMVDAELAKLPDHMSPVTVGEVVGDPGEVIVLEREGSGWVLHLRGEVDAPAVRRLELVRRLEGAVVAIDVTGLTYLDSVALPPLLRWARAAARAGRPALVRGCNLEFDRMVGIMGMTSVFLRQG